MSDEYNSGGALLLKHMLKLFREAKLEMEKEKYEPDARHQCLRCKDEREVWVWRDTSESEKIRVDCPIFLQLQRPHRNLEELGTLSGFSFLVEALLFCSLSTYNYMWRSCFSKILTTWPQLC